MTFTDNSLETKGAAKELYQSMSEIIRAPQARRVGAYIPKLIVPAYVESPVALVESGSRYVTGRIWLRRYSDAGDSPNGISILKDTINTAPPVLGDNKLPGEGAWQSAPAHEAVLIHPDGTVQYPSHPEGATPPTLFAVTEYKNAVNAIYKATLEHNIRTAPRY